MKIINLEQRSEKWFDFRRRHLGASDTPAIMGVSPWKTKEYVWMEKVFDIRQDINPHMQRGIDLEPMARDLFVKQTGIEVSSLVAEDETYPFLSASFDGISLDHKIVVEIKCPSSIEGVKKYPHIYIPQMQKQMYIADICEMYYFAYLVKEKPYFNLIKIQRNQDLIDKIIECEIEFWETIKDLL